MSRLVRPLSNRITYISSGTIGLSLPVGVRLKSCCKQSGSGPFHDSLIKAREVKISYRRNDLFIILNLMILGCSCRQFPSSSAGRHASCGPNQKVSAGATFNRWSNLPRACQRQNQECSQVRRPESQNSRRSPFVFHRFWSKRWRQGCRSSSRTDIPRSPP